MKIEDDPEIKLEASRSKREMQYGFNKRSTTDNYYFT